MNQTATEKRKYTPPEVAAMWGVSPDKIIGWILAGELRAINAASRRDGRPRYLIDVDALEEFERARSVTPPPQPVKSRKRQSGDVPNYV